MLKESVATESCRDRGIMMMQTPPPAPAPLPTLEQSFELLKEFKLGTDSTVLIPIERAVMEVHGN